MKNAFMIAATGSGCGKTTITCALLQALKDRGFNMRSFKCGPDYIDPMFHKKVLGIPSKNLDLFFTDEEMTKILFLKENDSDISVVEGVMGLYDGMSPESDKASSYDLACALDIPVILVVNATGMGRSVLAVIKGFLDMDYQSRIKAVILNRISSSYFENIRPVIEKELGICVLGYCGKMEKSIESRYLGLALPEEMDDIRERTAKAGEMISKSVSLDKLLEMTRCDIAPNEREIEVPCTEKVRIAVARDEAFCFCYEDNLDMLRSMGAEIVEFSPIHSERLPEGIDGLLLGGGYPELHAKKLEENRTMRDSIRHALGGDMPVLAECGGFMYLHESICDKERSYEMCKVINGECRNTGKLVRFGYINIHEKKPAFLTGTRTIIKGHEFHYYDSTDNGEDAVCVKPVTGRKWSAGHISSGRWMGFAHLYYPSNPEFAAAFIEKCVKWRDRKNGKLV